MVTLGGQSEGNSAGGRPKTTWRRTVEAERRKAGWRDWDTARTAAKDREAWGENVMALRAYWHDESFMTKFSLILNYS